MDENIKLLMEEITMQVLAHNVLSQFASRQLNIAENSKRKRSEKLSSGYRINRSADDAAGLQISEKMRSQVRGMNRASENIQDGISMIQVADGALEETHAILQRARELSVQAANDINQKIDRDAIQEEIETLTKEVDRIAYTTNFNNEIYPLLGGDIQNIGGTDISGSGSNWKLPPSLTEVSRRLTIWGDDVEVDGIEYPKGSLSVYGSYVKYTGEGMPFDKNNTVGFCWLTKNEVGVAPTGIVFGTLTDGQTWRSLTLDDMKIDKDGYVYYHDWKGERHYIQLKINDSTGFGIPKIPNKNCLRGIGGNGNMSGGGKSNYW